MKSRLPKKSAWILSCILARNFLRVGFTIFELVIMTEMHSSLLNTIWFAFFRNILLARSGIGLIILPSGDSNARIVIRSLRNMHVQCVSRRNIASAWLWVLDPHFNRPTCRWTERRFLLRSFLFISTSVGLELPHYNYLCSLFFCYPLHLD